MTRRRAHERRGQDPAARASRSASAPISKAIMPARRWPSAGCRALRRLRPTDVVKTLDRSARLELDLRLEAASISEMAENIKDDEGFVIPEVSWDHTAETVLTTSWVEGIPIRDLAALDAAGLDRKALAKIAAAELPAPRHPRRLLSRRHASGQSLRRSQDRRDHRRRFRHHGPHLARASGASSPTSSMASSPATTGMIAQRHFDIGYVPRTSRSTISRWRCARSASRCRAAPPATSRWPRCSGSCSRPPSCSTCRRGPSWCCCKNRWCWSKGVSRALDPDLDIWTVAEPVVGDFVRREAGPLGRLEDLRDQACRWRSIRSASCPASSTAPRRRSTITTPTSARRERRGTHRMMVVGVLAAGDHRHRRSSCCAALICWLVQPAFSALGPYRRRQRLLRCWAGP